MDKLKALVDKQAEDETLWFVAEYVSESYLQIALRNLHRECERLIHESIPSRVKENFTAKPVEKND